MDTTKIMAEVEVNCDSRILAALTELNEITNIVLELREKYRKSLIKLGKT